MNLLPVDAREVRGGRHGREPSSAAAHSTRRRQRTEDIMPSTTYTPLARTAVQVRELHDGLLRVTRPDGAVLGYVERMHEPQGERFRAKRLRRDARGFVPLGDFWALQDAVDCLRF
jgi:hypothetical protein